jgi:excisionase family DNA binding protein
MPPAVTVQLRPWRDDFRRCRPHHHDEVCAMDDDIARAADAKKGSPFLTTDQAAHYVGLSRQALEKMRRQGRGPRFRKHGRYVRYHIADLEDWSNAHRKNTTSESDRHVDRPRSKDGDGHV